LEDDIGLDDEPVAHLVLAAQVLAHPDHRHRDLVAEHHRFLADVAEDAWVLLTESDDLDVREAQSTGIVAHQQFVRGVPGHGYFDRLALAPQVLQASAK
jgi:hypothetical protein